MGLAVVVFVDIFIPHVFSMFCFCQHCSVSEQHFYDVLATGNLIV